MEMTKQQRLAAELEGSSLLVSAAAGSGKTSVLTERVIRKLSDSENGSSADALMILTFTDAAAAEMRTRITSRLRELVKEQPDNAFLRRQLMLLPAAKISTIHSACLGIVRNNFQLCGIDPQFSIGDENRLELMKISFLEDFTEEIYEMAENDPAVSDIIEYFTRGRDDEALSQAIYRMSEFLLNTPYEQEFIDYACNMPPEQSLENIFAFLESETADILRRYDKLMLEAADYEKLISAYSAERDFAALLQKHISDRNYDSAYKLLCEFKFKNHPTRPKDADVDVWELFKNSRNELKDRLRAILSEYIYADRQTFINDRRSELSVMRPFLMLCKSFNERLFEKRKKLRILSFDDIEKYTLSLLISGFENGKPIKTPLAKELSESIDEIIVDEYQDCNRTQNLIFNALSRDGTNIFMVGDVKQSIYRFRGAQPEVFLEKQLSSLPVTEYAPLTVPSRVDLSRNFRSNKKILEFVNSVFLPLMTGKCGGIDYSDGHRLVPNPDAVPSHSDVELHLLLSGNAENSPTDKLSKTQAEAKHVADKIKALLCDGTVFDSKLGKERRVTPSDIAVLMRAPRTDGMTYEKAFINAGIPYINNNPAENYLDTPEVRSVLAYLQAIDNPYDDIPLVTLMYSDFFSFTPEKLASIRVSSKHSLFFDAVKTYAKQDAKTDAFVKNLEYLRSLSLTTDVYGIISAVYESSGILLRLSERENADAVKANLMLLLDYAEGFESDRYRGLFAFINYIIKLSEKGDGIPAARLKKSGGCVNILSIHGSKGLEYPIVFLVGAGNDMRKKPSDEILADGRLGIGGFIRDRERRRDFSSAQRNLMLAINREQELNEYMRLLYVALTRPVNSLYITAVTGAADFEKIMRSVYMSGASPEKYDICEKPSFFKWMMFSLIKTHGASEMCAYAGVPDDLCVCPDIARLVIENVTELEAEPDAPAADIPKSRLDKQTVKALVSREYAYRSDTELPAKLSVSEIKGIRSQQEDFEALFEKRKVFKKPAFLQGRTGTDVGNATHHFLQFCDFDKITDSDAIQKEKTRLVEYEFITKKEAELVECEKILRFLNSDIMRELNSLGTCSKEQRFLFTVPANELIDTDSDSKIIVQGILDCLYIKDGKAIIVDYKTDAVKNINILADRYRAQLNMYEKAVKHIKGIDTMRKYIYSFHLEQFTEV